MKESEVIQIKNNQKYLPNLINQTFNLVKDSRYPVQIAEIPKDSNRVVFKKDALQSVLQRAGSRPVICVSVLGSYQQGKSTTLGGITGSYGYEVGVGMKDKTKGVNIDGPYDIDYLYDRFNYPKKEDSFFLQVKELKPVVFFFDIEGYGGLLHGKDSKKNDDLFIQLCTPFMCISSVFICLSPAAPQTHELETIVDALKISTLTSLPKSIQEDTNGELKLIVAIKSVQILGPRVQPYSIDEIDTLVNDAEMKSVKDGFIQWSGLNPLSEKGIQVVFAPLMDPQSFYGYTKTFGYLAHDVISGINLAAQGHFMRGYQNCLNLYDFIISHYHDGKFSSKIKDKIAEEYQNTLGHMALRILHEIRDIVSQKVDAEYEQMQKNPNDERGTLNDLKNKYFEFGQQSMEKRLNVVGDSSEIHRYYQLLCHYISLIIDKKEKKFRQLSNDNQAFQTIQSKKIAMEFYTQAMQQTKVNLLQTLKSNNYFDFNKDQTKDFVTKEISIFPEQLRSLKKEKNLEFFTESDITEISKNFEEELTNDIVNELNNDQHLKSIEEQKYQAKIKFENIIKQKNQQVKDQMEQEEKRRKELQVMENNKKEAEIQRQRREALIISQNRRAKIIINDQITFLLLKAFTDCERFIISNLKEKLEDKKYYLQTYSKVRAIYDHIKENIKDELHHLRERIIGYAFEDLKNEAGDLLDAIIRVYDSEKDTFITFELIDKFVEDRFQMIIEDVFCAYNTAKRLLTTFSFEAKKERTKNASKYAIYFRKITIYPDGKKVPDDWKLARNEKRSLLNQFLEFINYKDYTYVKKIDQHQYTELLNLFENKK